MNQKLDELTELKLLYEREKNCHRELEAKVTDLEADLHLNASMLARQTDLAREAEEKAEDWRNNWWLEQAHAEKLQELKEGLEKKVNKLQVQCKIGGIGDYKADFFLGQPTETGMLRESIMELKRELQIQDADYMDLRIEQSEKKVKELEKINADLCHDLAGAIDDFEKMQIRGLKAESSLYALRGAYKLMREASYQTHSAHFDPTGGSGTGCPECIRATELRDRADLIGMISQNVKKVV